MTQKNIQLSKPIQLNNKQKLTLIWSGLAFGLADNICKRANEQQNTMQESKATKPRKWQNLTRFRSHNILWNSASNISWKNAVMGYCRQYWKIQSPISDTFLGITG